MDTREDAYVVQQFAKITMQRMRDVLTALPALVPQSKEDEILFRKGMTALNDVIYDLEHAESVRDYGKVIDIKKVLKEFDAESIRTLDSKINQSARASIEQLTNMADCLQEED